MDNNEIKLYEAKNSKHNILLLKASDENNIINTCQEENFNVYHTKLTKVAINQLKTTNFTVVIAALGTNKEKKDHWEELIKEIRYKDKKTFIVIFSYTASNTPKLRYDCFAAEVNMVTDCLQSLKKVLAQINKTLIYPGKLTCPYCNFSSLTEDGLWIHLPLYHVNVSNSIKISSCPLCLKKPVPNLPVHYRNMHGPCGRGEIISEFNHEDVTLYAFSLVVVFNKKKDSFLLVQEFANSGYWLPGGRVDPGEDLQVAAIRECQEEAGVDIKITGVLSVQFNHGHGRLRTIFYGEPLDEDQKPKSIPDYESAGACYVKANELKDLPLRGDEPLIWIPHAIKGKIYPLDVFAKE